MGIKIKGKGQILGLGNEKGTDGMEKGWVVGLEKEMLDLGTWDALLTGQRERL